MIPRQETRTEWEELEGQGTGSRISNKGRMKSLLSANSMTFTTWKEKFAQICQGPSDNIYGH